MFHIDSAQPGDSAAIEALLDLSFGPGRQRKTSYRYRDGIPPAPGLSFVAREEGRVVGTIAYWPLIVGGPELPALLLGPVAAHPDRQGDGIGAALMRTSMAHARALGHRIVLLVGDIAYYRRFGFSPAAPLGFFMPGERQERLQVTELVPGALEGAGGTLRRADGALPTIPMVESRMGRAEQNPS